MARMKNVRVYSNGKLVCLIEIIDAVELNNLLKTIQNPSFTKEGWIEQ